MTHKSDYFDTNKYDYFIIKMPSAFRNSVLKSVPSSKYSFDNKTRDKF